MAIGDDPHALKMIFERLLHLAGYAAYLLEESIKLNLTATALEKEGDIMPSVGEILKQAAADARTSSEAAAAASTATGEAIQSAINRLADNQTLTEDEKAAIMTDLEAAKTANDASAAASAENAALADTVDPDAPGGVVTDPDDPEGVIEAPPA